MLRIKEKNIGGKMGLIEQRNRTLNKSKMSGKEKKRQIV